MLKQIFRYKWYLLVVLALMIAEPTLNSIITGSVPALQSAMTHRITTASVSIEVSLKRKIPFQSAS